MTLDHLVYATPDLEESVRQLGKLTGVRPVEGGPHPGLGTRNHLLGLGELRYLEIIGPDPEQPEPEGPRPFGIDELTEPRLVGLGGTGRRHRGACRALPHARLRPGPDRAAVPPHPGRRGAALAADLSVRGRRAVPDRLGRTPHPARHLPVVPLTAFGASHPEPARVRERLAALGVELDVREGEPALVAMLGGTTTLT